MGNLAGTQMVLPLSPQFSLPSLTFVFSLVMSNLQPVLLLTLLKTQACSSLGLLSILSVQHKFSKADIFFFLLLYYLLNHIHVIYLKFPP